MATTRYQRSFSFSGFQANQPKVPLPGQRVDIEFDAVAERLKTITAYELAVDAGFTGSLGEWLASLVGPPGSTGPVGPPGVGSSKTTPEEAGAPAIGDSVAIAAAIATAVSTNRQVDFLARDYGYNLDSLDTTRIAYVPPQARLRSVMAGDSFVRARAGAVIGLAQNHRQQSCYTDSYPRNVAASPILSGNVEAPPISTAQAAGPVDIAVHWYGDWGLDFYRQATGIADNTFDHWYDWGWNWTGSVGYDAARHSVLGYYRNDDPNTLDTQAYWLREAGVKVVIPVAFDLEVATWGNANDRNLWVYRLFNAPNFKGLSYIPWARTTNFDNPDGAVTATAAQVLAQWQSLWNSLAPAYPNNYVLNFGGKRWFTVYCWNTERLRQIFDVSGSANFAAWLKLRADEVIALGYDGLCVMSHNAVADATMSKSALLGNNVLYLPSPYGGPTNSNPASADYAGVVASYAPPTTGQVLNVSTSLLSHVPLSVFNYPGSTPVLWRNLLAKAIRQVANNPALPPLVTIYALGEWAEGGPGLHPERLNGWAYLDAIRWASSLVGSAVGTLECPVPLYNGWSALGSGNKSPVVRRNRDGWVGLAGSITGTGTAAGTIIAVLPPRFRPLATEVFPVGTDAGAASITIDTVGNVRALTTLSGGVTSLSGIVFVGA